MATFDALQTSWTVADVQHFGRRAGFGLTPEQAATLASQSVSSVVDAWVDQTADMSAFNNAILNGDVVTDTNYPSAPHPFDIHGYYFEGGKPHAQAWFTWRMQYSPNPLQEKLALFFHQLWATGCDKVANAAFMQTQIELFHAMGTSAFGDHLLAVSKDTAMVIWLDTRLNKVPNGTVVNPDPTVVTGANENYAREIMELYSLGVDNGYNQDDIHYLALAFTGWSYTPGPLVTNPSNSSNAAPDTATFRFTASQHATGTIPFLGTTIDINPSTNPTYDAQVVNAILTQRGANCASFLAKRLLTFFVNPNYSQTAHDDLANLIQANGFNMGLVLKAIFKSQYFFDPSHRWATYEGPIAWIVRGSRMLCPGLAAASAPALPLYPALRAVSYFFGNMGQDLLNPAGPNGWAEDTGWIDSGTMASRAQIAADLAYAPSFTQNSVQVPVFPSNPADWFPTTPATAQDVYNRLVALLQPAPIPTAVRDNWLAALWPTSFTWDITNATTQLKARELAYMILSSAYGQLH